MGKDKKRCKDCFFFDKILKRYYQQTSFWKYKGHNVKNTGLQYACQQFKPRE